MALSHGTAARTAMCNAAVDLLDTATATLNFRTAGGTVLCTVNLAAPAFGAASGASASLLGVPLQGTVTSSGTCTNFIMADSAAATVIAGTVGTSGADINLSSVSFEINNVIQIDAITYTAAP